MIRGNVVGLTEYDLPVNEGFVSGIRSQNAKIRVVSRWLNAVSVEADDSTISRIIRLPYVTRITHVASYTMPLPALAMPSEYGLPKAAEFNYGPSLTQISQLAIDSLHNDGLSGQDILIGIMDTGFDTTHEVFALMDSSHHIVATRNFIDGGDDVMGPIDAQRFHGTAVLSTIGGFRPGSLIGPAYRAKYVLARTEILDQEIMAEEDYWVSASEWMESLGVDIISSSLGYIDWYDTTQLNGDSTVITRAANIAVSLGVIVVNSAGNEGNSRWQKVTPPADGDSVIAAGAVDADGLVPDFSSRGPTADGRIKPDFAALGVSDYVAIYTGGYGQLSGTSFSAPLLAGGIALLLEGHPQWKISDIIANLKVASSNAGAPNNAIGWGIPNFVSAYYSGPFRPRGTPLLFITPQPAHDSVIFSMTFPIAGTASLSVHDVSGAKIREFMITVDQPSVITRFWDGKNVSGEKIASGIYICVLSMGSTDVRAKLAYFSR